MQYNYEHKNQSWIFEKVNKNEMDKSESIRILEEEHELAIASQSEFI